MRRVLLLICLAILVNFPWAHQLRVADQLDRHGRDVTVRVVSLDVVEGRYLVRYQVPGSTAVFSARVRQSAYDVARQGGELPGRVVPGSPGENRLDGQIQGHATMVLAVVSDIFLAVATLALWVRRRRTGFEVVSVADDVDGMEAMVTIHAHGRELVTRALPRVRARLRPGGRTRARLSLLAHTDLVPGGGPEGLVEAGGASYLLSGRVVDVGPGWLDLQAGRLRVRVRVGSLRARADLRESAQVTGELWLA